MSRPAPSVTLSLSARFSSVIEGLRGAVAARSAAERALTPLLLLVWSRLGLMARRFASAAPRVGAPARVPAAGAALRDRPHPSPSRSPTGPRARLPQASGWLLRLAPGAASFGGQLQHLLADPEMVELLAAAPGAKPMLRSLCRMLAIEPGPELALPAARARSPRAPAVIPAHASDRRPARGQAAGGIQGNEHRPQRVALDLGIRRDDGLRWRPADRAG